MTWNGVNFLSHAFLYGVNTENGVPACDKTSSRSKMTWSLLVWNAIPLSDRRRRHIGVAVARRGFVVVVGVDGAGAKFAGKPRYLVPGDAVTNDQRAAARGKALSRDRPPSRG